MPKWLEKIGNFFAALLEPAETDTSRRDFLRNAPAGAAAVALGGGQKQTHPQLKRSNLSLF